MLPNSIEACKTQFVNQVKEGDFVRWGNTKKVTGLRRADLEAGWDGIVQGMLISVSVLRERDRGAGGGRGVEGKDGEISRL